MDRITAVFVTLAAMLIVMNIGITLQFNQLVKSYNNLAYVKAICDYAHGINDGESEKICGEAQDYRHVEYLCAGRSTPPQYCWVEQK